MRVSLSDVGRRGRMDLTIGRQNERTIVRSAFCEVPFKITRLLDLHTPVPHLILMHSTAGIFGGDELECTIRIERGARVRMTQQSATKVHPSQGRPAIQRTHVFVEAGAELQLYLEPVIPFADSSLKQTTVLNVAEGGKLAFWEGYMAGRLGRGESWRFRELTCETRAVLQGRLMYLDRFHLGSHNVHRAAGVLGTRRYFGTGLFVGEDAGRFATRMHESLPQAGVDSPAPNLAAVRIVAENGPVFHNAQEVFCQNVD